MPSVVKYGSTPSPLLRLTVDNVSKEKRKRIQTAIKWMLPALIGSRLTKNIDLHVRFVPNLGDCVGDCDWIDNNANPRQFLIRVSSSQSERQQLITLAHELVHLKQFVTNEMFDYAGVGELTRWKQRVIDPNRIAYRNLPWEKDAMKMQGVLVKEYLAWLKSQS